MRRSKSLTLTLALLAVAMLIYAAPAVAAGGPKGEVTGSIALSSVNGVEAAASGLGYGSYAAFDTAVDGKLAKHSEVYVTVLCHQGTDIVYQWSAAPDFSFPLVDQPGVGLDWDGGAAICTAHLRYKVTKGRNTTITALDTTTFNVG